MSHLVARGLILGIAALSMVPAHADQRVKYCDRVKPADQYNEGCNACDVNPNCGTGRGAVPGYLCWRNEANSYTTAGDGRLCVPGEGNTVYVYSRGPCNLSLVEVYADHEDSAADYGYADGTDVFAPNLPPHCG